MLNRIDRGGTDALERLRELITDGVETTGALARQMTPMRMMQERLCVEPALAREAAGHATAEAMAGIRRILDRTEAASLGGV